MNKELAQQVLDVLNDSIDCVRTEHAIAVENYGSYPSRKSRIDGLKAGVDKHEAAIAQPVQPAAVGAVEVTEKQIEQGLMALLQCSCSELESYSPNQIERYTDDVRRVVFAAIAASKEKPTQQMDNK